MKQIVHRSAAIVATLCIATFFLSTAIVEFLGDQTTILKVKSLIVMPELFILIPCLAVTGATGFLLAEKRTGGLVDKKSKRMPFIILNGLLVLLPSALYLDQLSTNGDFNFQFYSVQSIELLAGGINLFLMSLNIRDGLMLSGRRRIKKVHK